MSKCLTRAHRYIRPHCLSLDPSGRQFFNSDDILGLENLLTTITSITAGVIGC